MAHVPPSSLDAEQAILGGLMLDVEQDSSAWDIAAETITEEDFYKPAHQKIFSAIKELAGNRQVTNLLTVTQRLRDKNELDSVGGPAALAQIVEQSFSTVHLRAYCEIVAEKGLLRRLIATNNRITEQAYASDFENVNTFLDQVEGEIFKIADQRKTTGLTPVSDIVKFSIERIEELYEQKGALTGVPSGFTELDKMTAGFQGGEMIILAARPSMGKTAFSLNLALHAAVKEKKGVAYFSVEMGKEQMMMRLIAQQARINLQDLRTGRIPDSAWPQLIAAASLLSEAKLWIDDTSGISPFEIRAKARRLKSKDQLDIIFVDYLQLMKMNQKVESREREVAEISRLLKEIAKELKIPVVALAQVNRGVEGRADRRPMLSDLRESGSIEQDADLIMMLYRDDYYDKDDPEKKGVAEVHVNKHRNGPTGVVPLAWQPQFGSFANLAPKGMAPPPRLPDPDSGSSNRGTRGLPNLAPL